MMVVYCRSLGWMFSCFVLVDEVPLLVCDPEEGVEVDVTIVVHDSVLDYDF